MARIETVIEVRRVREVKRALDRATDDIKRRVQEATRQTALEVAADARSRVPVRTGELRNTIRAEPGDKSPYVWFVKAGFGKLKRPKGRASRVGTRRRPKVTAIGSPGIYAAVIEFGSSTKPARPFMFPALEAARSGHIARVSRAIKQACDAAGNTA